MLKLYGIKNCDSVKKAIRQLQAHNIPFDFIDLKTCELSDSLLADWFHQCPEYLVNKRSTTYRQLKEQWLTSSNNQAEQIHLIQSHPTLLKRPIIVTEDGTINVGLDSNLLQQLSL